MTAVYFFAAILVVLLASVLLAPLFDRQPGDGAAEDGSARLGAALDALRELEFEFETGKIGEDDYQALRAGYAAEAIEARDQAAAGSPGGTRAAGCPVCEARVVPGAKFCSRCGTGLTS